MATQVQDRRQTRVRTSPAPRWSLEKTLKEPAVEELVNRYWHRPLAFRLILRPLERTEASVTPNQLTLASGAFGAAAGGIAYLAADRGPHLLLVAGLLLLASVILDCSDGMLARLTGQSSRVGMLLDGFMDFFVGLGMWFGLSHTLIALAQPSWGWPLAVLVLLNCVIHTGLYDQFKNTFARNVSQTSRAPELGKAIQRGEARGIAWVFEGVYRVAYGTIARALAGRMLNTSASVSPERYRQTFTEPMRWFACLGLGSHLAVIYVATMVGAVAPNFAWNLVLFVILGALNVVTAYALIRWRRANQRIARAG